MTEIMEREFKNKLQLWIRSRESAQIKVIKSQNGNRYGLGDFETELPNFSRWKILFDLALNIHKINDVTNDCVVTYDFAGYVRVKSTQKDMAVFLGQSRQLVHRFNERKQFVFEYAYKQLFIWFDNDGTMHFKIGHASAPTRMPYYSTTIASFPLNFVPKKPTFVELDEKLISPEGVVEEDEDVANRDLDERAILLLFADGNFT